MVNLVFSIINVVVDIALQYKKTPYSDKNCSWLNAGIKQIAICKRKKGRRTIAVI